MAYERETDWIGTVMKDPDERLDYGIDWSEFLAEGSSGNEITTSVWTATAGITAEDGTFDATGTAIWVEGGTLGENYTLTNRIVDTDGREAERSISILVRDL